MLNPTELKAFENSEQGTQGKVYEVMLNELAPGSYTFGIYIALTSDRLMARSSFRVVPVREGGNGTHHLQPPAGRIRHRFQSGADV